MNRFVKEQLSKVKVADLPPYDDSTKTLLIKKQTDSGTLLKRDGCYIIQVQPYILTSPDGFTLHDNWNRGIPPKHEVMKAEVTQLMGKMVKINSVGYDYENNVDTDDVWEGWLPIKSIKVLGEL
jgi:hypothetical protein